MIESKGKRYEGGLCLLELRARVPEWMYEEVIRIGGGRDKSEVVREWLADRLCGHLETLTGRRWNLEPDSEKQTMAVDILASAREHMNALAVLNGQSQEEYLADIVYTHLYGIHGPSIARAGETDQRGDVAQLHSRASR